MARTAITTFLVVVFWTSAAFAHDVIVKSNSHLRAEPTTASISLRLLKPGDEAKLLEMEKSNGYYRVVHAAGVGWLWGPNVRIMSEYLRDNYKHWIDADTDCQKTRDEVLIAEADPAVPLVFEARQDNKQCKVISGRWTDPYTGLVFTEAKKLDVDHMVPLKNAHRSGAWEWTFKRREDYSNDLANSEHLIAVDASANRSKSWKGPDRH